jgi:phosphoglycerate-specific signal transduction histidine kinase
MAEIKKIDLLPTPPQSGKDTDEVFIQKGDTFLSALPALVEQVNPVIDAINVQMPYIQTNYENINNIKLLADNISNVNYFASYYNQFDTNYKDFLSKKSELDTKIDEIKQDTTYLDKIEKARLEIENVKDIVDMSIFLKEVISIDNDLSLSIIDLEKIKSSIGDS